MKTMTHEENVQHGKLLKYMLGWKKGTGGFAFRNEEFESEDFKAGFDQGRADAAMRYEAACKTYNSSLLQIIAR